MVAPTTRPDQSIAAYEGSHERKRAIDLLPGFILPGMAKPDSGQEGKAAEDLIEVDIAGPDDPETTESGVGEEETQADKANASLPEATPEAPSTGMDFPRNRSDPANPGPSALFQIIDGSGSDAVPVNLGAATQTPKVETNNPGVADGFFVSAFPPPAPSQIEVTPEAFVVEAGMSSLPDAFPPPPDSVRGTGVCTDVHDALRNQTSLLANQLIQSAGIAGLRVLPDHRNPGGFSVIAQQPAASDKEGTLRSFLTALSGATDDLAFAAPQQALIQQMFLWFENGTPPSDGVLRQLFQLIESVAAYARAVGSFKKGENTEM